MVTSVSSPVIDRETVEWKIKTLRNAIGHDWAVLATEGLSSEQRKATRERLKMRIKDLRQIVGQRQSASEPVNLEARSFGIDAQLKTRLAAEPHRYWQPERTCPPVRSNICLSGHRTLFDHRVGAADPGPSDLDV